MKIEDSGRKTPIDKNTMFNVLNIVIPFVIFLLSTILIIQIWKNQLMSDLMTRTKTYGREFGTTKILTRSEAATLTNTWYVIYFDASGNRLDDKGLGSQPVEGIPEKYVPIDGEGVYEINGESYIALSMDVVKENEYGATHLMIFRDIESENAIFEKGTAISITIMLLAMGLVIVFSAIMSKYRIRPYKKLVASSNRMIYDISHELNTPLAVIKTNVDNILAHSDKSIEDSSDKLMVILDEATRMKRMVRDLLELSRSDNNRVVVNKTYCNVSQLLQDLVEPFELMCEMDDKTFISDIAPNIMATTDADKIRQAVMILLDNAVKYTRKGDAVIIQVRHTSTKVHVSVADTGKGVSDEDLEKIFDRFYRADNSRTQSTGGSGLGLSIVKSIAQTLKWNVHASHNSPHGFRVDIEMDKTGENS